MNREDFKRKLLHQQRFQQPYYIPKRKTCYGLPYEPKKSRSKIWAAVIIGITLCLIAAYQGGENPNELPTQSIDVVRQ